MLVKLGAEMRNNKSVDGVLYTVNQTLTIILLMFTIHFFCFVDIGKVIISKITFPVPKHYPFFNSKSSVKVTRPRTTSIINPKISNCTFCTLTIIYPKI